MRFPWQKYGILEGEEIDLKEERMIRPTSFNDNVREVFYGIFLHGQDQKIGECDLRVGMNDELYYAGNIGYRIYERWRGHSYALQACRLLLPEAFHKYGMDEVIITCSPDNIPSRRTLEKLSGTFVEETGVPAWHWLYRRGETVKRIYRFREGTHVV
ncbi:MAG: GNAT family N-acetyltransferase [Solobacterium sp.]|nr:GNAT family N-acetyltransferase [Solobacterium sp.]